MSQWGYTDSHSMGVLNFDHVKKISTAEFSYNVMKCSEDFKVKTCDGRFQLGCKNRSNFRLVSKLSGSILENPKVKGPIVVVKL